LAAGEHQHVDVAEQGREGVVAVVWDQSLDDQDLAGTGHWLAAVVQDLE
jgi:hypothetical protein